MRCSPAKRLGPTLTGTLRTASQSSCPPAGQRARVLFRLFVWYGETPIAHAMNSSEWMFPIVEVIHMIGIVLLVGTAVILDLRLMGLRLKSRPVWELASDLTPWTTAGLVTMLITGPLLLSTDADRYYDSYEFRFKMACLA